MSSSLRGRRRAIRSQGHRLRVEDGATDSDPEEQSLQAAEQRDSGVRRAVLFLH